MAEQVFLPKLSIMAEASGGGGGGGKQCNRDGERLFYARLIGSYLPFGKTFAGKSVMYSVAAEV